MRSFSIPSISLALAMTLAGTICAQDNQNSQGQGQDRPSRAQGLRGMGGMDWQNMDPQQMQERFRQMVLENYRTQLEVENDAEWQIIEERLSKVTQARQELGADGGGMMGMGGLLGRGRGGGRGGGGGGRGLQGIFGQPSAEAQALQQAVDSKAPSAELKAKLARLLEVRKEKQATLTKAQDELRKVLSVRRESIAVLIGLLD